MESGKGIIRTQLISIVFAVLAQIFISLIMFTKFCNIRILMLLLVFVVPVILGSLYTYVSYKKLDGSLKTSLFIIFPNLLYLYIINNCVVEMHLKFISDSIHKGMRFYIVSLMLILVSWISVILGVFIGTNLKINKLK